MNYKDILALCETMCFLSKITFKVHVTTKNGKDINEVYKSKNGIMDMLDTITNAPICKPIYFKYDDGSDMDCEVAFLYDPENNLVNEGQGTLILSYANYCTTIDHGTHVEGFKTGLSNFMTKYVRENCLSKKEQSDMSILGDDVRNGMIAIVNVRLTDASFKGQVKEKLANDEMLVFVRNVTVNALNKWAKENPPIAKKLGEYIKNMAKIRINSAKEKKQTISKNYDNIFSQDRIPNWSGKCTCLDDLLREIQVVEGDSAAGTLKQAMIRLFQEIYKLRGIPKNTVGIKLFEALKNDEIRGLTTVLSGGKGNKIRAEECPYDKVILETDKQNKCRCKNSLIAGIHSLSFHY
jgi:Type IIA topoisomerase (DNA gyrase/topo II, topoisomerase IV), B subunit